MTEYNEAHNNDMGNMDNRMVREEGFEGIIWHSKKGMFNLFIASDLERIRRTLSIKRTLLNDDMSFDTFGKEWYKGIDFADTQDSLNDVSEVERILDEIEDDPTTLIPHLEKIVDGTIDCIDLFIPKHMADFCGRHAWSTPVLTLRKGINKSFSLVFLPKTFRKVRNEFVDVEVLSLQDRKDETIRRIKSASNWITAGGYDMIRAIEKADDHETLDIIDRSRDWKSLNFSDNK